MREAIGLGICFMGTWPGLNRRLSIFYFSCLFPLSLALGSGHSRELLGRTTNIFVFIT